MCLKEKNENAKEKENDEDDWKGRWRRMNELGVLKISVHVSPI